MPLNHLIIGLSGVTCSGKTTLSASLSSHFPPGDVRLLPLDDYFIVDTSRLQYVERVKHYDYDTMDCLEWDKYHADIQDILQRFALKPHATPQQQILILDGFLLFNEPRSRALCHLKYDFTLPYEVAKFRRETRIYDPPDVPGYFDEVAWPAAVKHSKEVEELKKKENIVTLHGTDPPESILQRVLYDIEQFV